MVCGSWTCRLATSLLGFWFGTLGGRSVAPMDITSPYLVVSVIIAAFVVSILFATSSKEDCNNGHDDHQGHGAH
jgi:hypothetical protein